MAFDLKTLRFCALLSVCASLIPLQAKADDQPGQPLPTIEFHLDALDQLNRPHPAPHPVAPQPVAPQAAPAPAASVYQTPSDVYQTPSGTKPPKLIWNVGPPGKTVKTPPEEKKHVHKKHVKKKKAKAAPEKKAKPKPPEQKKPAATEHKAAKHPAQKPKAPPAPKPAAPHKPAPAPKPNHPAVNLSKAPAHPAPPPPAPPAPPPPPPAPKAPSAPPAPKTPPAPAAESPEGPVINMPVMTSHAPSAQPPAPPPPPAPQKALIPTPPVPPPPPAAAAPTPPSPPAPPAAQQTPPESAAVAATNQALSGSPGSATPTGQASATSNGAALSIVFKPTETAVPLSVQTKLDGIAKELIHNQDIRVTLIAYASAIGDEVSTARRVSLSRALSVRAYLIDAGVDNLRINVQAEGDKNPGGNPDRVDIMLQGANGQ